MLRLLATLALLAGAAAGAASASTSATFATEDSTAGWATVKESLAQALVHAGDAEDRRQLDDTIRDDGLPRNDRQFLRARPVQLAVAGHPGLFVRPATQPHANAFYGAHTFRFWFVDAGGRLLFTSTADKVAVLPSVHEGMHDLRVSQCRGGECFETDEVFERGRYRDGACVTTSIASGQASAGCR
ncbi:MAG TPA: hypothetical protein VF453_12895 [Burkholderiaceae bacterium]